MYIQFQAGYMYKLWTFALSGEKECNRGSAKSWLQSWAFFHFIMTYQQAQIRMEGNWSYNSYMMRWLQFSILWTSSFWCEFGAKSFYKEWNFLSITASYGCDIQEVKDVSGVKHGGTACSFVWWIIKMKFADWTLTKKRGAEMNRIHRTSEELQGHFEL